MSYNEFNVDKYSCILVCGALKECDKIYHFGINDASGDSSIRFVNSHPTLTSINLEDSLFKKRNWESLSKILSNTKKFKIENLSLKFCTIHLKFSESLIKAFKKNVTLKYLNLYNTGIDDECGPQIIFAFLKNETLEELNLGANKLRTNFCKAFGAVLRVNYTLRKVNITKNYLISRDDYFFILEGLVNNQSIISLGDLIDMKIGVKCRECTEKLLNLNKNIEWRELEQIKKQKSNLYFSNLGKEYLQYEEKYEEQLKKEEEINERIEKEFNEKDEKEKSPKKNLKLKPKGKEPENYKESVKKILKEYPNKYYKESVDKLHFKAKKENDDNNIIIKNPTQKISNLSLNNFNKQGKYIVPYSLEKTNYIKELEQYQEDNADGKNKKKRAPLKSAGKVKKGKGKKSEPTLLNILASITQEKFDKDEELKEFGKINPENMEEYEENYFVNTEEDITYGNIDLEKKEIDEKENQNFIEKYNLIENNFSNEFQEQTPFYY